MSATDELRRMLDERGVEWVDTGDGSMLIPAQTATNVAWDVNRWPSGKDMGDCLWVQNRHPLTPEQAIAATLGGDECEFVDDSDGEPSPPKCSVCGYDPGIYECAWYEDGTYGYERNYCPNCGRRVVE